MCGDGRVGRRDCVVARHARGGGVARSAGEDRILAHLPALYLLLTGTEPAGGRRKRTRRGADARHQVSNPELTGYLRDRGITLTYDPAAGTLQAGTCEAAKTIIRQAS